MGHSETELDANRKRIMQERQEADPILQHITDTCFVNHGININLSFLFIANPLQPGLWSHYTYSAELCQVTLCFVLFCLLQQKLTKTTFKVQTVLKSCTFVFSVFEA